MSGDMCQFLIDEANVAATSARSGDMCRFLLDEISLRMCISVSSYYEEMGLW
jgi:hypothetical protein